jgi:hypothetical protein
MAFSKLTQTAEAGIIDESKFGSAFAGYGFGQEMYFDGSNDVIGFFVEAPTSLEIFFDVVYSLAAARSIVPTPYDLGSGINSFAVTSINLTLCNWTQNVICNTSTAWSEEALCFEYLATDPCNVARAGTQSGESALLIPEAGLWTLRVSSGTSGQALSLRLPESGTFALAVLGLLALASVRSPRTPARRPRQRPAPT